MRNKFASKRFMKKVAEEIRLRTGAEFRGLEVNGKFLMFRMIGLNGYISNYGGKYLYCEIKDNNNNIIYTYQSKDREWFVAEVSYTLNTI